MQSRTLDQAPPGHRVKLVSIRGDRALSRRLLALGHDIAEQVVIEDIGTAD